MHNTGEKQAPPDDSYTSDDDLHTIANWLLTDPSEPSRTVQLRDENTDQLLKISKSPARLFKLFNTLHRKAFHLARIKLDEKPPQGYIRKRLWHMIQKKQYDMNKMGFTSADLALYHLARPKLPIQNSSALPNIDQKPFPKRLRLGTEPAINQAKRNCIPMRSGPACQILLSGVAKGQLDTFNELQIIDPKRQPYVIFRRDDPQQSSLQQIVGNFSQLPKLYRQNDDIASTILLVIALKLRAKLDDTEIVDEQSKWYKDYTAEGAAHFYELLAACINPATDEFAWLFPADEPAEQANRQVCTREEGPILEHGHSLTACLEEALKAAMQNNDELSIWLDSSNITPLNGADQSTIKMMIDAAKPAPDLQPKTSKSGFWQTIWTVLKYTIFLPFTLLYNFSLYVNKGKLSNSQAHKQSTKIRYQKLKHLSIALEKLHTITTARLTPRPSASFKEAEKTDTIACLRAKTNTLIKQLQPEQAANATAPGA